MTVVKIKSVHIIMKNILLTVNHLYHIHLFLHFLHYIIDLNLK